MHAKLFPGGSLIPGILPQADVSVLAHGPTRRMGKSQKKFLVKIDGKSLFALRDLGVGAIGAQADVSRRFEFAIALVCDLDELPQHRLLGVPAIRRQGGDRRLFRREGEDDFARLALALDLHGRNRQRRRLQRVIGQTDVDLQLRSVAQLEHAAPKDGSPMTGPANPQRRPGETRKNGECSSTRFPCCTTRHACCPSASAAESPIARSRLRTREMPTIIFFTFWPMISFLRVHVDRMGVSATSFAFAAHLSSERRLAFFAVVRRLSVVENRQDTRRRGQTVAGLLQRQADYRILVPIHLAYSDSTKTEMENYLMSISLSIICRPKSI